VRLDTDGASDDRILVGKRGSTQRTLTKVNHRVAQRAKLIYDLRQNSVRNTLPSQIQRFWTR
jgi:hypothetical protein